MATIGSLVVNLVAQTGQFIQGMGTAAKSLNVFEGAAAASGAAVKGLNASLGLIGVGVGSLFAVKGAITSVVASQHEWGQLNATLLATGDACKLSAAEIKKLVDNLGDTTTASKRTLVESSALLGTFKNVAGDTFKQAMVAALDYATKTKKELPEAIQIVGKALNSPINSFKLLKKAGIDFTEQQKNLIKHFVETNQVSKAQSIILDELTGRFGGSALAAAEGFEGELDQLGKTAGKLKKQVGEILVPFLSIAVRATNALLQFRGTIIFCVGAFAAYKAAVFATSKAQAIFMALSGPKAWAQLLIGAAAATAAVWGINKAMQSVDSEMQTSVAELSKSSDAMNEFAVATEKAAAAKKHFNLNVGEELIRKFRFDLRTANMGEAQKQVEEAWHQVHRFTEKPEGQESIRVAGGWILKREFEALNYARIVAQEVDAAKEQVEVEKKLNELAKVNNDFGKTKQQQLVDELKALHANKEQIAEALKLQEELDKKETQKKQDEEQKRLAKEQAHKLAEQQKQLAEAGRKMFEETLNPMEKYRQTAAEIQKLFDEKKIDRVTASRQLDKAFFDKRNAELGQYSPIAALERGSQAALSAQNKSRFDPLQKLNKTQQESLAALRESRDIQRDTKSLLENSKVVSIDAA